MLLVLEAGVHGSRYVDIFAPTGDDGCVGA